MILILLDGTSAHKSCCSEVHPNFQRLVWLPCCSNSAPIAPTPAPDPAAPTPAPPALVATAPTTAPDLSAPTPAPPAHDAPAPAPALALAPAPVAPAPPPTLSLLPGGSTHRILSDLPGGDTLPPGAAPGGSGQA